MCRPIKVVWLIRTIHIRYEHHILTLLYCLTHTMRYNCLCSAGKGENMRSNSLKSVEKEVAWLHNAATTGL